MTFIDKKFPIKAGMQFTYPDTVKNKIHVVGYRTVRFWFGKDNQLIKEKEINRTFI